MQEKWRETIDPFSIGYKDFRLLKVLGYPHAGNDVFYAEGKYKDEIITVYIKVERQSGADIENEVESIISLSYEFLPDIIEYSFNKPKYIITKEAVGKRLSSIVGENKNNEALEYMYHYGETLAYIHKAGLSSKEVKHRRFFEIPSLEHLNRNGMGNLYNFLNNSYPTKFSKCFVHGDFHYANILWHNKKISCVLDYELSGIGIREFDIAWSIVLRPSQRFLKSKYERDEFLAGYSSVQSFDGDALRYFYVLIASHFYSLGDKEYKAELLKIINRLASLELS